MSVEFTLDLSILGVGVREDFFANKLEYPYKKSAGTARRIADESEIDRVSTAGYALGYIGGIQGQFTKLLEDYKNIFYGGVGLAIIFYLMWEIILRA